MRNNFMCTNDGISNSEILPFEYVDIDGNNCKFIQNVEEVLVRDIQNADSFGCTIKGCHTHAGSKVHFRQFVEAELLFHNNYYNEGFAYLSADKIIDEFNKAKQDKRRSFTGIRIIGYENYSELYLKILTRYLLDYGINDVDYDIYENIATEVDGKRRVSTRLRFNRECLEKDYYFIAFIIPINTTLTTLDKMISYYKRNKSNNCESRENDYLFPLCLITIGNACDSFFWEKEHNSYNLLPRENTFKELDSFESITTLSFVQSEWKFLKGEEKNICELCFPDISDNKLSILDEEPLFDVNRASIVPMLQLGTVSIEEPINKCTQIVEEENLKKICNLSNYLVYHHVVRTDNHFQFYFQTSRFIKENKEEIKKYLQGINQELSVREKNEQDGKTIYNYIIAPRHETNAEWLDLVYSNIFNGSNEEYKGARILYFDVSKEYRSNFMAKYSDFVCTIQNIINSGHAYQVRFHFVDDTIVSGNTYLRGLDLVRSLIQYALNERYQELKGKFELFYSVFLLISRNSSYSEAFYHDLLLNNKLERKEDDDSGRGRFYKYVKVSISNMRNKEDACTLCKLEGDFKKIKEECATGDMVSVCSTFIKEHKIIQPSQDLVESQEKKLVFIISHILNERIRNGGCEIFPKEKRIGHSIEIESEHSVIMIKNILDDYYRHLYEWLNKSDLMPDSRIDEDIFGSAFIKSISRPFFTYYIRKRQASFSFCICELDSQLKKSVPNDNGKKKSILMRINSLCKALTDMNANYMIRCPDNNLDVKTNSPIDMLIKWAEEGDKYYDDNTGIFNSKALRLCYKKIMSLTQDTTKSLLLEHVLIYESEKGFFNNKTFSHHVERFLKKESRPEVNFENASHLTIQKLSTIGLIYLENNRIIIDAFKNFQERNTDLNPYYFDNFQDLCRENDSEFLIRDDGDGLDFLYEKEQEQTKLVIFKDIKQLFRFSQDFSKKFQLQTKAVFVHDKRIKNSDINRFFEYVLVDDELENGVKEEFYRDSVFTTIRETGITDSSDNNEEIVFFIEKDGERCKSYDVLIRIRIESYRNDLDEGVYFWFSGFELQERKQWFFLKMFLAFRCKIEELISRENMEARIYERVEAQREKALNIDKASSHANKERYLNLHFSDLDEKNDDKYSEKIVSKYLLFVSNEWISSLYRQLIRDSYTTKGSLYLNVENLYNSEANGCKQLYDKKCVKDNIDIIVKKHNKMYILYRNIVNEVKIVYNDFSDDRGTFAAVFPRYGAEFQMLALLIPLMVENMVVHSNDDGKNVLEVIINESGTLVFKNEKKVEDPNKEIEKIEKYLDVFPWVCETKQHICLWTLKHSFRVLDEIIRKKESKNAKINEEKRIAVSFSYSIEDESFSVYIDGFLRE